MTYRSIIYSQNVSYDLRLKMVIDTKHLGVRGTARRYRCSKNTVSLWLARFREEGRSGLVDRSRRPKRSPNKTAVAVEEKVLAARRRIPCYGPRRLKDNFALPCSTGAIARMLRERKLTRRVRKKHLKKNDLRAVKAKYAALSYLQMDAKSLWDIPHYWPQMKQLGLPRVEFTIRDVKSGAVFLAYSNQTSMSDACKAISRVFTHFQNCGIDVAKCLIQTDNGSEFDGQTRRHRDRGFNHVVEDIWKAKHRFIPPAHPNADADVESFHNTVEQEFFDLENFSSREDFIQRITTYQHHYNLSRMNYSKGSTPLEILQKEGLNTLALYLPPIDLDRSLKVGQNLPVLPENGNLRLGNRRFKPRVGDDSGQGVGVGLRVVVFHCRGIGFQTHVGRFHAARFFKRSFHFGNAVATKHAGDVELGFLICSQSKG